MDVIVGDELNKCCEGIYDTGEWMEYECGCQDLLGASLIGLACQGWENWTLEPSHSAAYAIFAPYALES